MGNVSAKQVRLKFDAAATSGSASVFFPPADQRKNSSGSSSDSSSQDFIDAESEIQASTDDERDLEDHLLGRGHEDAFMKAVLSFCAHMGGRMDNLDNARLYDEFCSYAAAHRPSMGVV